MRDSQLHIDDLNVGIGKTPEFQQQRLTPGTILHRLVIPELIDAAAQHNVLPRRQSLAQPTTRTTYSTHEDEGGGAVEGRATPDEALAGLRATN